MARVLVVEDDRPIAEVIADDLGDAGHLVDVVGNGAEALETLGTYRPDVVVLDLMLPVLHGWEFVERYRGHTSGEELPIVVVSAAGAVTRSMEARGVRRFLPKPLVLDELRRAIQDVLAEPRRTSAPFTS
jgi:two-component system, OmpR family, alkaline phosphatase synthesis response regulator PhoP